MGKPLTDPKEVLFRQIHPNSYADGRLASDRFRPQPSDDGLMSVDRGALTTAEASNLLFTTSGRQSAAVFGISVEEFSSESLNCSDDPLEADGDWPANPAHAVVDYNSLDCKKWKNISKRLTQKAIARGRLYPTT
jgi:hypothetical protein